MSYLGEKRPIMSNDNPFNEEISSFETIQGEQFNNQIKRKYISILGRKFLISENSSRPNQDGTIEEVLIEHVNTDDYGNPLPENPSRCAISHSGIVTPPEKTALCTSWLHWSQRSKIVALGQDGKETSNGPICSSCNTWERTLKFSGLILFLGVVSGILFGILSY